MRKSEAVKVVESPFGKFYLRAMVGGFALDASSGHIGGGPDVSGYDGVRINGRLYHLTIDVKTTGNWEREIAVYGGAGGWRAGLTDSAWKKLNEWLDEVRPELEADHAIRIAVAECVAQHAEWDAQRANRDLLEARALADAAEERFDTAQRMCREALADATAARESTYDSALSESAMSGDRES